MLTLFPLKHGISPSKTAGFYRMTNPLSVMGNAVKHLFADIQIEHSKFANSGTLITTSEINSG
jgi:hypothetical protein